MKTVQPQNAALAAAQAKGLSLYGQRSLVLTCELGRATHSAQLRRHPLVLGSLLSVALSPGMVPIA
jgi:hypothetical protein